MKKEITIVLDEEKMEIVSNEGLTNADTMLIAFNLLKATKENMEAQLKPEKEVSLLQFATIVINSMSGESKVEETK